MIRPLLLAIGSLASCSGWAAGGAEWWSFQRLAKLDPPAAVEVVHPVDQFLLARARDQGLELSPPAERRLLIRRAYFDLVGLPPLPEEVDRFVNDTGEDAWPRLIDSLLSSPHYGERWGRHWLDVARFAESSGFEHDYDREGAFHFRDFVIKALNADMPFNQFVTWQLAGDEQEPENGLALAATGFLGAGVFPTQITANEVERTRYDAMDDMLSTVGAAFLGVTVGCARCHDHKYDPVSARDYYRMLSTFTTTVRSVVELDLDPEQTQQRLKEWALIGDRLQAELEVYEASLQTPFDRWLQTGGPKALAWVELELSQLKSKAGASFRRLESGAYLVEGNNSDQDEYVLEATVEQPIHALRLEALAHPSMVQGGPGRADNGNIGLSRIRVTVRTSEGGAGREVRVIKAAADFEQNNKNLAVAGVLDEDPHTGWAIDPEFGRDHVAVFTLAEAVTGQVSVVLEFQLNNRHNLGSFRLGVARSPEAGLDGAMLPAALAVTLGGTRETGTALSEEQHDRLFDWWKGDEAGWKERSGAILAHAAAKPDGRSKVLICAEGYPPLRMHTQGADFFAETYFLKRGDGALKEGVAEQGFLPVLMREPMNHWATRVPEGAKFSGRRRALAQWLTDPESGAGALLARVAVNRLWQHHFGTGLVATPNDFGHTGATPTQPELLDWLAGELIRGGWKLKPIHLLIMTSAAYQQACGLDAAAIDADPENALWLRRVPRRLEAEVIRDALLAVSGELDASLYGPGTRDERSRRRSIYFTIKRSQLVGSMVAFDQPEPLVSQGQRPVTTVAPQALLLMNSPQVREWAGAFARRVAREAPETLRVDRAYRLAFGRAPTPLERTEALEFLNSYGTDSERIERGWVDLCQVILALNEFVYAP